MHHHLGRRRPCLLNLWKDYVRLVATADENSTLFKPSFPEEELLNLEIYYRKIDLYYSFSKSFNMEMDEKWVKEERSRVAKLIDEHLRVRIVRFKNDAEFVANPYHGTLSIQYATIAI